MKVNKGIYRVKPRPGKLSFMLYNKFLSGEPFDILETDYTVSGVKAIMTKASRYIVHEVEKTTRRERVLLMVIGVIIAGEIFTRVIYPVCG